MRMVVLVKKIVRLHNFAPLGTHQNPVGNVVVIGLDKSLVGKVVIQLWPKGPIVHEPSIQKKNQMINLPNNGWWRLMNGQ